MKHEDILNKMTLEEKAAFLGGKNEWQSRDIPELDIPSIFFSDGPHGIRKQAGAGDHLGLNQSLPATCFPTAATVANSWNVQLGEEIGKALGEEAAVQEVDVLLGPGLNIKRSPLCGRNFEYFSEDPYLAGKMAASYIKGIQKNDVFACPKHFAVNSQELRRMAMNAVVDERTMREIYLTGFEIAIKEGNAKALMSSYNQVNGIYANENSHLLQDILRKEWGYEGIVITDWGGSNDHVKGIKARSNLEMPAPGLDSARQILAALDERTLTENELDQCVDDLLDAVLKLKENQEKPKTFNQKTHHDLARRAAEESVILLKNQIIDGRPLLPLKNNCTIALIGDFAMNPRYQGAGSSMVNPTKVETMEKMIGNYSLNCVGFAEGYKRNGEVDEELKRKAIDLAQKADIVLYCFGLNEASESEGLDRTHMRIPQNQIELLEELTKVNHKIVGILSAGSAVEMPWQHCVGAILHGYLGGQASASAILNILIGKVNPSGRLSETYPVRYEDTPAFRYYPSRERNSEYRESLYVGYRYYDSSKVRVQYPFGFGLTYTTFEYDELCITSEGVSLKLTNTGEMDGAEVVQLYIAGPRIQIFRPEKELKGFKKVFLKAGETQIVKIPFDDKSFRYWNTKTSKWEIEGGSYQILIGASVSDIRLRGTITQKETTNQYPYDPKQMSDYFSGLVQDVTDSEFEALLGTSIPDGKWSGEIGVNDAVCQMYYAKSKIARFVYRILTKKKLKNDAEGKVDLNLLFQYNIPFRAMAKMTGGMISREMVNGIVLMVNGHFFKGIRKVIGGFFRNRRFNKQFEKRLSERWVDES